MPAGLDPSTEATWLAALAPQHAARVRRLREPRDRGATLLGLALLLDCCRAARLAPPDLARLCYPLRGKPAWPGGRDFSIAHGASRSVCALAPAGVTVGVDLEAGNSVSARQLRLVAGRQELQAHLDAGLTATALWVAKEAVVKAAGSGVGAARLVVAGPDAAVLGGLRYPIVRPRLAVDCVAAVAASDECEIAVSLRDGASLLAAGP